MNRQKLCYCFFACISSTLLWNSVNGEEKTDESAVGQARNKTITGTFQAEKHCFTRNEKEEIVPTKNVMTGKSSDDKPKLSNGKRLKGKYGYLLSLMPNSIGNFFGFLAENLFMGVVGLGSMVALFQRNFGKMRESVSKIYTTTLEVSANDIPFNWIDAWLKSMIWEPCNHVTVAITNPPPGRGSSTENFALVPNLETNRFLFKGRYVSVKRVSEEDNTGESRSPKTPRIILSILGWNLDFLKQMVAEARRYALEQTKVETGIWMGRRGGWSQEGRRLKRPLSSVILDRGIIEDLTQDVAHFIQSSQWYMNLGIPYRRGYLLYGPPGCGKTSVIAALAGHLNYGLSVITLSDNHMSDQMIRRLVNSVPQETILLFEDIDAAFSNRAENDTVPKRNSANSLTLSGLLNALDGVDSANARILFMTTNCIEKLDSALIRPGRIDVRKKIDYCSSYQISKIFRRFYSDAVSTDELENLENGMIDRLNLSEFSREITPAQMQSLFLENRDDPRRMIEALLSAVDLQRATRNH